MSEIGRFVPLQELSVIDVGVKTTKVSFGSRYSYYKLLNCSISPKICCEISQFSCK